MHSCLVHFTEKTNCEYHLHHNLSDGCNGPDKVLYHIVFTLPAPTSTAYTESFLIQHNQEEIFIISIKHLACHENFQFSKGYHPAPVKSENCTPVAAPVFFHSTYLGFYAGTGKNPHTHLQESNHTHPANEQLRVTRGDKIRNEVVLQHTSCSSVFIQF